MRFALVLLVAAIAIGLPMRSDAAQPPFELVKKSLAQARSSQDRVQLDLRVTQTGEGIEEWAISGDFTVGAAASGTHGKTLSNEAALPLRLLWIATLSSDPVASLTNGKSFVNERVSTVGVQEDFVYVYGTTPGISVYRDLRRLAAFSVRIDEHKWVTRLFWSDDALVGIMITRDGAAVLTARSQTVPRSAPDARGGPERR